MLYLISYEQVILKKHIQKMKKAEKTRSKEITSIIDTRHPTLCFIKWLLFKAKKSLQYSTKEVRLRFFFILSK